MAYIAPLGKQFTSFLKSQTNLPYDPVILLLDIYPKEIRPVYECILDLYMNNSIIHNSPTWKQPKCPLAVEQINKTLNIHTTLYHLALKRNETTDIGMLLLYA